MVKHQQIIHIFTVFFIIALMLVGTLLPTGLTEPVSIPKGFAQGISYKPYIPLKRTTFVQFDGETLLDDYAYLAAVPTCVFYDKESQKIYTNPLLYYEDPYQVTEQKERSLNARQGIDYFMEDWMPYSKGYLDQMTLINVPQRGLDSSWKAQNITSIQGNDPYDLASKIALHDWSYSNNAVVSVIQPSYVRPNNVSTGTLTGTVSPEKGILTQHFDVPKTNEVYPIYNEFNVPQGYKLLTVRSWYPSLLSHHRVARNCL